MPTKNVVDERISKFKNKGKDPTVSGWISTVVRVNTLFVTDNASRPLAETARETHLRVRGAPQSAQEWEFPEEEKHLAVVSPGRGGPLSQLHLQRDGRYSGNLFLQCRCSQRSLQRCVCLSFRWRYSPSRTSLETWTPTPGSHKLGDVRQPGENIGEPFLSV